ncbi:hypothetical protein BaRGS_00011566 [Batillaria attramentaria]|uniref:Uncharacterized protein n=1 Tax=Batillaria attramentaria TaxID=370345 RepID=A0ABD0LDA3_9CAEN
MQTKTSEETCINDTGFKICETETRVAEGVEEDWGWGGRRWLDVAGDGRGPQARLRISGNPQPQPSQLNFKLFTVPNVPVDGSVLLNCSRRCERTHNYKPSQLYFKLFNRLKVSGNPQLSQVS